MGVTDFMIGQDRMQVDLLKLIVLPKQNLIDHF